MFKPLLLFWTTLTIVSTFNVSQLPALIKRSYHGVSAGIINVTVGQKFSLPLPTFDSPWNNANFQAYQLSEDQFNLHTAKPKITKKAESLSKEESNEDEVSDKTEETEPLSMDYLPFECSLTVGKGRIVQEIASIREQYTRVKGVGWIQNSYVLLPSKSLLYILNTQSLELLAYIYNEHTLEKITSYKLNYIQKANSMGQVNISPPVMALNSIQSTLYIFSSLGIWAVQTKTILSNVRPVDSISHFNSRDQKGLDKVIHGDNGVIVGLKRMKAVYIIPQPSLDPSIKYTFTTVNQTNQNTQLFPQDIFIHSNTLFILDFYKGVYIYSLLQQGQPEFRSFIPLNSFGNNYQFTINGNTLFVNFNDIDASKVAQISIDLQQDQFRLVRYYKSDEYITKMKVFMVPTEYYLQPYHQKYNQDSFDRFLFLLQNSDDLQIYPFNLDPRIINQAYNAVKIKGTQIREVFHIASDRFLLVTSSHLKYLKLSISKPSITCLSLKSKQSSPESFYRLQLTSNLSTCEHKDHSQPQKRYFNEYCEMQTDFYLHIGDPEASQHQKALLYGVVLAVLVLFVGGLLCLMQWKNNKMVILGRLKNEIMNFRNRHKKIQPFVEENYEHKQIQIEVPKVEAVLENQV